MAATNKPLTYSIRYEIKVEPTMRDEMRKKNLSQTEIRDAIQKLLDNK